MSNYCVKRIVEEEDRFAFEKEVSGLRPTVGSTLNHPPKLVKDSLFYIPCGVKRIGNLTLTSSFNCD